MRPARRRKPSRALAPLLACAIALGACARGVPDESPRVLVIGLDGATFDVLDPLLAEGALPHLAALRARGREGFLESTVPPISPPAWTSAVTGVNPGKHNIFDFFHFSRSSPQPLLTSSLDRKARPVWQLLNEAGFPVGILNIPMTFPPDRVDGFFVSGFPHGSARTGFTYPASLEAELGDYPLDLFGESLPDDGQEELLLAHLRRTLDRHGEEALRLLREEEWRLFWVVFTGTDKVQHFFWKFGDPDHPGHDPSARLALRRAIRDFWIRADEIVGELVAAAGPEAEVMILSDHGFGPIHRELRLSRWLREEGFWSEGNARAVAPGPFGGAIRVNVAGRDHDGQVPPGEAGAVRSEIRKRIEELRDPVSGEPLAESVHAREEVFHGPYLDGAPDLLFLERPGMFVGRGVPHSGDVFGPPSYTFSAFHRRDGVLIAAGPSFAPNGVRGRYSILDIVPTIYWLFDVEAPRDLDGRVPPGLIGVEALDSRPLRVGGAPAVLPRRDAPVLEDREVLESLGYVR